MKQYEATMPIYYRPKPIESKKRKLKKAEKNQKNLRTVFFSAKNNNKKNIRIQSLKKLQTADTNENT